MGKRSDYNKIPKDYHHSYKHGHRYANEGKATSEYQIWSGIKKRVQNPNCNIYEYYGGRGIDMDPRWEQFESFFSDVGERPSPNHSLDRVDNSKGYWKGNVKWSTMKEQSRNRKSNVIVDWTGKETCLKEACEHFNWRYKTVWSWFKEGMTFPEIKSKAEDLWGG